MTITWKEHQLWLLNQNIINYDCTSKEHQLWLLHQKNINYDYYIKRAWTMTIYIKRAWAMTIISTMLHWRHLHSRNVWSSASYFSCKQMCIVARMNKQMFMLMNKCTYIYMNGVITYIYKNGVILFRWSTGYFLIIEVSLNFLLHKIFFYDCLFSI